MLKVLEPEAYHRVQSSVDEGVLPLDTFLRLDSLGDGTPDETDVESRSLRWKTLLELSAFAEAPEHLPPRTRNMLYSEPPRALLAWNPSDDAKTLHTAYDRPYLLRNDLSDVIKERRVLEEKTVTVVPRDRRWRPPEEIEHGQCQRIAHGLWRVLAKRIMPEWLEPEALDHFYRPYRNGTSLEVGAIDDPQIMNRRIVGAIALKVTHIKEIYDESLRTGVSGIGPIGKQDLRTLLADEYPELY